MKARPLALLPSLIFIALQPALAQDISTAPQTTDSPIALRPIIGKPQLKVLKVEDGPKRHYERWIETTLVVLGNLQPSAEKKVYLTENLKNLDYDLQLRTHVRKADFAARWSELRQELETTKPKPETWGMGGTWETPQFNAWDLSQWERKKTTTLNGITMAPSSYRGEVRYAWLTRTFEMEGVHVGKKTMFKANVCSLTGPGVVEPLELGNTFDNATGQIFDRKGRPVPWQQSFLGEDHSDIFKANGLSGDVTSIFNPASSREKFLSPE